MDGAGSNGIFRRSFETNPEFWTRIDTDAETGRNIWGAKITPRRKKVVIIITSILCGYYFYYLRYQNGAAQAKVICL